MYELLLIVALTVGGPDQKVPTLDLQPTHPMYRTVEECQAAGFKAHDDGVPTVKGYICRKVPGMTEI